MQTSGWTKLPSKLRYGLIAEPALRIVGWIDLDWDCTRVAKSAVGVSSSEVVR